MEREPQIEDLPLDRFEDAIDMLDFVYEKIDHAIYLWVVWSKAFGCDDEQAALRAVLEEIVSGESDILYKKLRVEITQDEDGTALINARMPKNC